MSKSSFLVHIVDDDPAIRRSLDVLLQTAGFATQTYQGPLDLLENMASLATGCLLVDIQMKDLTGVELMERLLACGIRLPMIAMTGLGDVGVAVRAMKLGAIDYLQKPFGAETLFAVLAAARAASAPARHLTVAPAASIEQARTAIEMLSARERQVLQKLSEGKPQKIIAHELGISARTVEVHRARMLRRLGTPRLAQAIRTAVLAELAGRM